MRQDTPPWHSKYCLFGSHPPFDSWYPVRGTIKGLHSLHPFESQARASRERHTGTKFWNRPPSLQNYCRRLPTVRMRNTACLFATYGTRRSKGGCLHYKAETSVGASRFFFGVRSWPVPGACLVTHRGSRGAPLPAMRVSGISFRALGSTSPSASCV